MIFYSCPGIVKIDKKNVPILLYSFDFEMTHFYIISSMLIRLDVEEKMKKGVQIALLISQIECHNIIKYALLFPDLLTRITLHVSIIIKI